MPRWRIRPRSCASGAAASGLALTVSQWADRHRVFPSRPAAGVEPCRISRTPKMQGIIKALSSHNPLQPVVFMQAAQVGATRAGTNWTGCCIHRAPGPVLQVQSAAEPANRLPQLRIHPPKISPPRQVAMARPG
ncbi:MAG: phage terminase large subunit family protein [Rhodobacter sp.]|nr:phage terminase large subunit family protein [Rhodobacter sp.]